MFTLQKLVADPLVAHVPKFAMELAQSSVNEPKKAEAEAKAKMASDLLRRLSWTAEGWTAMCKAAGESIVFLTCLLATAQQAYEVIVAGRR